MRIPSASGALQFFDFQQQLVEQEGFVMKFTEELARNLPRNLPDHLPTTDEIIRALGLQVRRKGGSDIVPSIALFGAGLLVGAGLALLFAPSSGRELREELGERAAELRDRATGAADELGSRPV